MILTKKERGMNELDMLTVKRKKVRKWRTLSLIWGICNDVKPMYAATRRRTRKAPVEVIIRKRKLSRRWYTYPQKGVVYALPFCWQRLIQSTDEVWEME